MFVKREIALSRQCRDLLTDNSVGLIVPSCRVSQDFAMRVTRPWILSSERGCNSCCWLEERKRDGEGSANGGIIIVPAKVREGENITQMCVASSLVYF